MNPKNILIIGSYGASNIGDEAMLEVMLKELPKNTQVSVLSGNPEDTKMRHEVNAASHLPFGIRSFFSFKWFKSLKFLEKSDLVLIGGGGLFTDSYRLKAVLLWTWHVLWAKMFGKRIILFANSVGPLKSNIAKSLTRWSLSQCEKIIVRDQISADCVKKLLPNKEYTVGADLVFLKDLEKKGKRKKLIALNFRDWNMDFDCIEKIIRQLRKEGYGVLLIPTETTDEALMRSYTQEHVSLVAPKNFNEMLEILSTCEKALGMRLHFLIAASIAGCELGGIAYSTKVEGILDELKVPYQNPKDFEFKRLFQEMKKAENLSLLQEKARDMFSEI